ncbi:HAMP domain-containing sensor histidine kinase [soil metagenome]
MFHHARISLTAWYLVIVLAISVLFSFAIFSGLNNELERFDLQQQVRQDRVEHMFGDGPLPPNFPRYDPRMIQDARQRLIVILGAIDLVILLASGVTGYFLAGRTLRPIQRMVDEQYRFITDASHELRTPLTSLRSEIEVNLRDKHLSLSEAKKLLESNLEEVVTLQNLSDTLLQLSEFSPQRTVLTPLSLSPFIEQVIKKINPIAKKKHITLTYAGGTEKIRGMEIHLQQILMILLDNAIKYSPKNTTITILSKRIDHTVVIEVRDQGIGIAEKDIPHIFKRFYRAASTTSNRSEGYGLGLSLAKKMVIEHNGSIHVQSVVNKGTTFTLKFPSTDKLLA